MVIIHKQGAQLSSPSVLAELGGAYLLANILSTFMMGAFSGDYGRIRE